MHKGEGEGGRATFVYGHSNVTCDCEIAHVLLDFSKEGEELTTVGKNYSWFHPFSFGDKDLSNC